MRTRDVFSTTDFYEPRQLMLHLHPERTARSFWWRAQVLDWCQTEPSRDHHDCRPHVVALIDEMAALDWSDERVERLLDQHVLRSFKLGQTETVTEFLSDVRELIAADLVRRPVGTAAVPQIKRPTRLHELLDGKTEWDDATWFRAERYLTDNTTTLISMVLVDYVGLAPEQYSPFKTDNIRLLRQTPPVTVLAAWERDG